MCFGSKPYGLINAVPGCETADAPAPRKARLLTTESGAQVCSILYVDLCTSYATASAAGAAMHSAFVHWALPLVRTARRKWVVAANEILKGAMASSNDSPGAALRTITILSQQVCKMLFQAAAVRRLAAACSQACRSSGNRIRSSTRDEVLQAELEASRVVAALETKAAEHLASLIRQHSLECAAVEAALQRARRTNGRKKKRGQGCSSCGSEVQWARPEHWDQDMLAAYPPEDFCDGCWDAYYEGYCALCQTAWCGERSASGHIVCEMCLSQLVDCPLENVQVFDAYSEYNAAGEAAMARSIALTTADVSEEIQICSTPGERSPGTTPRKRKWEEVASVSAYEQARLNNLQRNRQILEQLGLVAPLEISVVREEQTVKRRQAASRKELIGTEREKYIARSVCYSSGEIYPVPNGRDYGVRRHGKTAAHTLSMGTAVSVEWFDVEQSKAAPLTH